MTNGTVEVSHYSLPDGADDDIWSVRTDDYFGVTQLDVAGDHLDVRYIGDPSRGDADTIDRDFEPVDEFRLVQDANGTTQIRSP